MVKAQRVSRSVRVLETEGERRPSGSLRIEEGPISSVNVSGASRLLPPETTTIVTAKMPPQMFPRAIAAVSLIAHIDS